MRIGDLARKVGIATSAIRYYEAAGVLPRAARISGRRVYGEEAVIRLRLVAIAQAAGFTLRETTELLRAIDREGWRPAKFDVFVARKIIKIDEKLAQLAAMRGLLERGKACKCLSLKDCGLYAESLVERGPLRGRAAWTY